MKKFLLFFLFLFWLLLRWIGFFFLLTKLTASWLLDRQTVNLTSLTSSNNRSEDELVELMRGWVSISIKALTYIANCPKCFFISMSWFCNESKFLKLKSQRKDPANIALKSLVRGWAGTLLSRSVSTVHSLPGGKTGIAPLRGDAGLGGVHQQDPQ